VGGAHQPGSGRSGTRPEGEVAPKTERR
jgi:hypothetical protein